MLVDIPNNTPKKNLQIAKDKVFNLYNWPIIHNTPIASKIIKESFFPNLSYIFLYIRTPKIKLALPSIPPKLKLLVAKDS